MYPNFKAELEYEQLLPKNTPAVVVSAPQVENVEDSEFLEFGQGEANQSRYLGDKSKKVDVAGILNNSLLPQSLKDRFGVELQSKSARDKFKQKQVKAEEKILTKATLQTKGQGFLSKGNIFETLVKSKPNKEEDSGSEEEIIPVSTDYQDDHNKQTISQELGKMFKHSKPQDAKSILNQKIKDTHKNQGKSAFASDQNHTSFSSILEDMEKKMSQAKGKSQKGKKSASDNPQFGLYSKKSIKKPDHSTKRSNTKFGKGKQSKVSF